MRKWAKAEPKNAELKRFHGLGGPRVTVCEISAFKQS
jgi:hypothetical protein